MSEKHILSDEEKIKVKNAKKELNRYRSDVKYITEKLNDTEEIRTTLEKVTTILTPGKSFSSGASPDKFADGISDIKELTDEIGKRTMKMIYDKIKIDNKIDMLPAPYRDVLFYRYSRRYNWREVADKVNYNEKYVTDTLHKEALYLYSRI